MRQRRPGVWELRVYLGLDPRTERQRWKSRTVRGGKRDAQRALAVLVREVEEGKHRAADGTLGHLLDRWLEHIAAQGRSPATLATYRGYVEQNIRPHLGHLPLHKVTPARIDAFYSALRDQDTRLGGKMSPGTIRQHHSILAAAFAQAVRWRWLGENPCDFATPPRSARKEITPPSVEDVQLLIAEAEKRDPTMACFIWLAATTGARRGELCAVRWSDVNLDAGWLVISSSVVDSPGLVQMKDTKTHQARRVALDAVTAMVLGQHKARMEQRSQEHALRRMPRDAFVFSDDADSSHPLRPDRVSQFFARLTRAVGVKVRLHDLRHFVATQAIAAGVDVRTVAGRLGHSGGGAITMRVYAHFLETPDRAAAEHMGALLAPNTAVTKRIEGDDSAGIDA